MLRLTLRTLLAWLDGVLPPEEADAFKEKLSSSGSARILVDRIRAVVAHPGLDAPKVVGRGLALDANSVAEYLTNSLPADSVAAFERVCIESDAHLAEVASCHRMLVEARNDPRIFEPPEADQLDRLLAKTGGLPSHARKQVHPPQSRPPQEASVPARPPHEEAPPAGPRPRGETPKASRAAWASVVVAGLLVAVLAGALAWRLAPKGLDRSLPRNPDAVAVHEPAAVNEAEAPVEEPALQPDAIAAAPAAEEPRDRGTEQPPAKPEAFQGETPARETPPAATEPPQSAAPQPTGRVPGGDALAIAAKSPAGPAAEPAIPLPPAAEGASKEAKPDEPSLATVGVAPLLLQRVGQAGGPADWAALPAGAPVATSVDLLAPEGFSPTLAVGNVTIRLIGPARAVLRRGNDDVKGPRDDATAEIELVFGRAIVSGVGAGRSLRVAAGSLAGRLDGGDPIGLEVQFERTPGSDPTTEPATAIGSIAFPAGGRLLLDRDLAGLEAEGIVRPDGSIASGAVITGRGPVATGTPSAVSPIVAVSKGLPDWLASPSPLGLLDRLAADSMAASLVAAPPPDALERLLADSRLENRSAAAATLAIMGRYEPLAELLATEEPGRRLPARAWETVERATIPLALARGPASAGRLLAALEAVAPPDAAKLVRQLAVGFSDEAIAAGGGAVMVASLEHPSLLVRRLAAARLSEVVPLTAADRLRYRPDGPQNARAEAVKWWRSQLEKGRIRRGGEGGLSNAEGE